MSTDVYTDVIYKVGLLGDPCITVRPCPEDAGLVEICTVGKEAIEYFGAFNVAMEPKMARALAKALLSAADNAEAQ